MKLAVALLPLICLAACGSGESVFPHSFGLASSSHSCSTDPDHGPNGWIDPTDGKRAVDVFPDSKAATLADAVKRNDIEKLKRLLAEGSDASASGNGGVTILDWALRRDKPDAFNVLLQSGADPTKPGLQSRSAIHDAAIADDTAYLSMLLARHADINVKTQDGETPLGPRADVRVRQAISHVDFGRRRCESRQQSRQYGAAHGGHDQQI